MAQVEVRGLKQSLANLLKLKLGVQHEMGRKAVLQGLLVINRAVKAATYTTFNRISGFSKSGFGVRVGRSPKGDILSGVIVQYPQSTAGTIAQAFNRAYRKRAAQAAKPTSKRQAMSQVAFWWRFIEFGTDGRRAARTPKARKTNRKPTLRSQRAQDRYNAAPSRGDLFARPWVRPSLGSSQGSAVEHFHKTLRDEIEKATANMPKGGT